MVKIQILNYNVKMLSFLFADVRGIFRAKLIPPAIKKKFPDIDFLVVEEIFDEGLVGDGPEQIFDRGMRKFGFKYKSKKVGKTKSVRNIVVQAVEFGECQVVSLFNPRKKCGGAKDEILKKVDDGGIKIYSKYRILRQKQILFKEGSKDDVKSKKGAVRITVKKEGQTIHLIGTHLQSGKKAKEMKIKKGQFQEIRDKLINQLPDDEPIFISGDFNLDPIGQVKDFKEVMNILNTKRLRGPKRGSTSTDFNTGTRDEENRLLDHIIYVINSVPIRGFYNISSLKTKQYRLSNKTLQNRNLVDIEKELIKFGDTLVTGFNRALCELDNVIPFTKKRNCKAEERRKKERLIEKERKKLLETTHLSTDLSDHQPVLARIDIGRPFKKSTFIVEPGKGKGRRKNKKKIIKRKNLVKR